MTKIGNIFYNRYKSGEIFKPWLWIGIFLKTLTRPIPPGVYFLNFIVQRIFRINSKQKFMVHFTSTVSGKIELGKNVWVSFATSNGCYIQGDNGIKIMDDTIFAPGVKIISANHDFTDFSKQQISKPIHIGKKCWIGANAVILPEVELGDYVIVGAGSVVTKSFPANVVIGGVPAKILKVNTIKFD